MLRTIIMLALIWLSGAALPGQQTTSAQSETPALTRWEGNWSGAGKFFGQAAAQRLQWERLLGGKFMRLTMRVENGGKPLFEGHAYYRQTDGAQYEARWFDSQGHIYLIKAQLAGDTLTAFWGEPGGEEGKSVYRLLDGGQQLEVVDAVRNKDSARDGSWREFGRFVLKRTAA